MELVLQVSGLWQNWQRILHPCKKITNRTPGPSTEPKLSMEWMEPFLKLNALMCGAGNHIKLLLACQVNEFHRIAGYTDGKVGVFLFFRMFHGIHQLLYAKHIYI